MKCFICGGGSSSSSVARSSSFKLRLSTAQNTGLSRAGLPWERHELKPKRLGEMCFWGSSKNWRIGWAIFLFPEVPEIQYVWIRQCGVSSPFSKDLSPLINANLPLFHACSAPLQSDYKTDVATWTAHQLVGTFSVDMWMAFSACFMKIQSAKMKKDQTMLWNTCIPEAKSSKKQHDRNAGAPTNVDVT